MNHSGVNYMDEYPTRCKAWTDYSKISNKR